MSKRGDMVDTCLILGASGDIGLAISRALIASGFRCFLSHSRKRQFSQPLDKELPGVEWRAIDLTDHDSVSDLVNEVALMSNNQFNLIYCAGVLHDQPLWSLSPEHWREVMAVNLDGAFYAIRNAYQSLAVGGMGRIVLVGSVSGQRGYPGQAAYSASKAGLEALCRVAAVELGRFGVCCNVIAPGALESGMVRNVTPSVIKSLLSRTPTRKLGTVDHVAHAVLFLLSPMASHINGQTLVIDGGLSIT